MHHLNQKTLEINISNGSFSCILSLAARDENSRTFSVPKKNKKIEICISTYDPLHKWPDRVNLIGFTMPTSGKNRKHLSIQKKFENIFKNWLCPNFSCCPKNLSCPPLFLGGGRGLGGSSSRPPRLPRPVRLWLSTAQFLEDLWRLWIFLIIRDGRWFLSTQHGHF